MAECFRKYYSYSYEDIAKEEVHSGHPSRLHYRTMYRLRMYANLFCRDMRKILINSLSYCLHCHTSENLTIDHITPISKGGKNDINNTQILCKKCNLLKSNKTT
ncbi:MAG: HNH endonuclease [Nanoarchaeota archaeon]